MYVERIIFTIGMLLLCVSSFSQEGVSDSTNVSVDTTSVIKKEKSSLFNKIYNYLNESNEVRYDKKLDISFIGGPFYSSDTKLGLGLISSGLFRTDRSDLNTPLSDISVYANLSTSGFYSIGVSSNIIFSKARHRITTDMYFLSMPQKYWGIGYNNGYNNSPLDHKEQEITIRMNYQFKLVDNVFLGATGAFRDKTSKDFEDIRILRGENKSTRAVGIGLNLSYDSRDFIPNPSKGLYIRFEQMLYPKFLGKNVEFTRSELIGSFYKGLWKGQTLAFQIHGAINYGHKVPWNMLEMMGGSRQMRGYYLGQYRDKGIMQTQIEFRQKVYNRHGVVAWAGVGNIFPKMKEFDWSQTLHTFGVGYRWEFKNRVNIRFDYGFGKKQSGFYFNIYEAF